MARWLGIDHGGKRIGVAVGGAGESVTTPLEQLSADDPDLSDRIVSLAAEYDATGIVVGWPVNADGSEGPQGALARAFAISLAEATGLDVRLWDERLSSFEADDRLKGSLTRTQKKRRQDSVAAAVFLADFLSADGPNTTPPAADVEPDVMEAQ